MEFTVLLPNELLFGNGFLESLHAWDPWIGQPLAFITKICHYLGSNLFFMTLLALSFIAYSHQLGSTLAWGLLTGGMFNSGLKFFFKSPRPMNLNEAIVPLQDAAQEFAFGFPSGHVHSTIMIWGLIFLLIKNRAIRVLSIFIICAMPFARMYMGVHYLGDVLGGIFFGIINLWIVYWLTSKYPNFPVLNRMESQPRQARSIVLATIAISLSPVVFYDDRLLIPEVESLNTVISASAALAGFVIGSILLKIGHLKKELYWGDIFSTSKPAWLVATIRVLVFVLGIVLLYLIPSMILKKYSWGSDILVRYLRYFVVGLYIIYIMPVILYSIQSGVYMKKKINASNTI
jgi:membrane-associated phospholipid phosphatase